MYIFTYTFMKGLWGRERDAVRPTSLRTAFKSIGPSASRQLRRKRVFISRLTPTTEVHRCMPLYENARRWSACNTRHESHVSLRGSRKEQRFRKKMNFCSQPNLVQQSIEIKISFAYLCLIHPPIADALKMEKDIRCCTCCIWKYISVSKHHLSSHL